MAIKPILFSTEMVRAILDGRKTCTRRLPKKNIETKYLEYEEWVCAVAPPGSTWLSEKEFYEKYPPYQPGDILYVRETWQRLWELDGNENIIAGTDKYYYKATDTLPICEYIDPAGKIHENVPWRPSIHMPKEAARIWLKVTDVRVERLQDITEDGAKSEGANWKNGRNVGWEEKMKRTATERFAEIWNSTIKKSDIDRYGWEANPYVFVIEFSKIDKPEEVYTPKGDRE